MENQIKEILEKHNINYVESMEQIKKYFDVSNLNEDGTPKIMCEHNVVLIADNALYNETYLIDYVKNFLEKEDMANLVKGVEFVYVDNVNLRHMIFNPSQDRNGLNDRDFERTYLRPSFIVVNAIEDEIHLFQEDMTPLIEEDFEKMLIGTKILSAKG